MYTIKANELAALLQIAAKNDVRYYLNGILLEAKGYAVATNGHMLLALKCGAEPGAVDVIMERDQVEQIIKMTPKDREVTIKIDGEYLTAEWGGQRSSYKALDGKFPEWRRIIPRTFEAETPGNFNPELLIAFTKVTKLLNSNRTSLIPTLIQQGPQKSAVVVNLDYGNAIGIVMPVRCDKLDANGMAKRIANFLGEPEPADVVVESDAEKVKRYEATLNEIAAWHDGEKVTGRFDEPGSAQYAREALAYEIVTAQREAADAEAAV